MTATVIIVGIFAASSLGLSVFELTQQKKQLV
jgi:hypothetical protein